MGQASHFTRSISDHPVGQNVHANERMVAVNLPGTQLSQESVPDAGCFHPFGQSAHRTLCFSKYPAGHSLHSVFVATAVYWPVAHSVQARAKEVSEKNPRGHLLHSKAPGKS